MVNYLRRRALVPFSAPLEMGWIFMGIMEKTMERIPCQSKFL